METKTSEDRRQAPVKIMSMIATVILLVAFCASPIYAWFCLSRHASAIALISNPTALYINAANQEDIRYLELSDINVEDSTFKDVVFCIRGNSVSFYRLQLAYTTNNQFTFEIYRAQLATNSTPQSTLDNAIGTVTYQTHPEVGNPVSQTYYIPANSTPIAGELINGKTSKLAYDYDDVPASGYLNLHGETYGTYDSVNDYAEPLYWQSGRANDTSIPVLVGDKDINNNFVHYYILRISWQAGRTNDKETDIIYISARNFVN